MYPLFEIDLFNADVTASLGVFVFFGGQGDDRQRAQRRRGMSYMLHQ